MTDAPTRTWVWVEDNTVTNLAYSPDPPMGGGWSQWKGGAIGIGFTRVGKVWVPPIIPASPSP